MATGINDLAASHNALLRPHYLQLRADLLLRAGQLDEAEAVLESARAISRSTDQQMFAGEWHRLRGQLILARDSGRADEAQSAFDDAMEVARWQGARLFEARARESLANLTAARTQDSSRARQSAKA